MLTSESSVDTANTVMRTIIAVASVPTTGAGSRSAILHTRTRRWQKRRVSSFASFGWLFETPTQSQVRDS